MRSLSAQLTGPCVVPAKDMSGKGHANQPVGIGTLEQERIDAPDDLLTIEGDKVRVRIAGVWIHVRRPHPRDLHHAAS
jgi:hypothetical protein